MAKRRYSKDILDLNPILNDPAMKRAQSDRIDEADTLLAELHRHAPDIASRFVRDFHFLTFKIDLADEATLIAVEVDGGFSSARGGKHATVRDFQKTRELALAGWLLLRFKASEVRDNPLGCITDIRRALAVSTSDFKGYTSIHCTDGASELIYH